MVIKFLQDGENQALRESPEFGREDNNAANEVQC